MENDFLKNLLYKKIVKWNDDELTLEDGTVLIFEEEQDCCAHASGSWEDVKLDAVITDVKFEQFDGVRDEDDRWAENEITNTARLTIFHNNNPIARAECYANNGNGGYYYSCLTLKVKGLNDDGLIVVSA